MICAEITYPPPPTFEKKRKSEPAPIPHIPTLLYNAARNKWPCNNDWLGHNIIIKYQ